MADQLRRAANLQVVLAGSTTESAESLNDNRPSIIAVTKRPVLQILI